MVINMDSLTKQELARIRNWNKARLIGITINKKGLTTTELALFQNAMTSIHILLSIYDKGYEELGLNSDPPRYNVMINGVLWKENIPYSQTKMYRGGRLGSEEVQVIRANPKRKKNV